MNVLPSYQLKGGSYGNEHFEWFGSHVLQKIGEAIALLKLAVKSQSFLVKQSR